MSGIVGKYRADNTAVLLGCAAAAALAAGCATTESGYSRTATYGAPSGNHYTGADRVFRNDYVDDLRPDSLASVEPTDPRVLAAFEGIEGARLAHRMYGGGHAERLDGACEQYVKATQGETLYDIAALCDVSISTLIDYNPSIRNPRHVDAGQILEIPQIYNPERQALQAGLAGGAMNNIQYASYYVVQPGDSLSAIAAKHLVSASAVANVNPSIQWASLPVGAQVKIPAAGRGAVAAPASVQPVSAAPVSGALPYPYGPASAYQSGAATAGGADDAAIIVDQPYALTPAQAPNNPVIDKSPLLVVDRRTVNAGGVVTVSAYDLPANTTVTLFQGPNGSDLDYVTTVTTDSEGRFSTPVTVRGVSNAGGVIFRATVDDKGAQLQSPRVSIDKIKPE